MKIDITNALQLTEETGNDLNQSVALEKLMQFVQ